MEYPRPAIGAPRPRSHVAESDTHADHVCDRIVGSNQRDHAPDTKRAGVEHGADLVADFPGLDAFESE